MVGTPSVGEFGVPEGGEERGQIIALYVESSCAGDVHRPLPALIVFRRYHLTTELWPEYEARGNKYGRIFN